MKSKIPASILEGLNEPQRKAVQHVDGPLLVLAGPGSGKTRVVTRRIAALLHQGIGAAQIAALTFTNKAADEMKKRLELLAPEKYVWIGTFHKFCAYLLRRYISLAGLQENFSIYDTDESLTVFKSVAAQKPLPPGITPQRIAAAVSWAKNQLVLPEDYTAREGSLLGSAVKEFYPAYQNELRRANAVDFDDLLLHIAVLLQNNPEVRQILDNRFRYILVDEYQDTNTVQYVIAKALSMDHRNLAVTGDPDQSIYGWRGANIKNILDFEKDFPDAAVVRLEENYRSTPQILAAADSLIAHNIYRKEKILVTNNSDGMPVRLVKCTDQRAEAEYIAEEISRELQSGRRKPGDYAVFYRMNALSRNFEHAFRSRKIPFQLIRGLEFFNRKEVKDVLAYLRVIFNPADTVSLMRIINEPVRGIGKTTMVKLASHASNIGVPTMEVMRNISNFSGIAAKTKKAVMQFVQMIDRLSALSAQEYPVASLIETVLRESNYRNQFAHSESEEDLERLANIEELLTVAHEFDEDTKNTGHSSAGHLLPDNMSPLEEFLEQAALVSDVDAWDKEQERVSLMTLHAAKGLEFPVVYITAIEEGILPHERSQADEMQLEEERRLFFVGITRAEEELRLSRVERRDFRGSYSVSAIFSRFLTELPNDGHVVKYDSPDDFLNGEDYGGSVRLVREKTAEYDYADCGDAAVDIDYHDVDDDEEFVRQKEKKRKNEKQRSSVKTGLSIMTGSELLKRKRL
ncbi:MAG: UvrD-helicase domain-containing protein [Planctomycetaceae bacterium]|nr:UvrD-helicase domain-containing protein [Planctomycetaceae bacterium]